MRQDVSVDLKAIDEPGGANTTIAFTISFTGSDPQTVAAVANTLASYYIDEDLKNRERQAGGTSEFLLSQLDEMKKKLDEQEKLVSRFKEEHIGELPEQRDANLATLERLNTELMLNSEKQIRARESRAVLARQLAASPGDAASRPDAAIERVAKLNQELADLRQRYSDKYPDVIRVRQEITRLQRQLAEPGGKGFDTASSADPYTLQLQQAIKSADAESRVIAAEEANLHKAIAGLSRACRERPAPRAAVPGAVERLPHDTGSLRLSLEAVPGIQDRGEHGASPEGRTVPDPRPGGSSRRSCGSRSLAVDAVRARPFPGPRRRRNHRRRAFGYFVSHDRGNAGLLEGAGAREYSLHRDRFGCQA